MAEICIRLTPCADGFVVEGLHAGIAFVTELMADTMRRLSDEGTLYPYRLDNWRPQEALEGFIVDVIEWAPQCGPTGEA